MLYSIYAFSVIFDSSDPKINESVAFSTHINLSLLAPLFKRRNYLSCVRDVNRVESLPSGWSRNVMACLRTGGIGSPSLCSLIYFKETPNCCVGSNLVFFDPESFGKLFNLTNKFWSCLKWEKVHQCHLS